MPRRPPTIRRWTLKLALCLLAGAVVTWGVAWASAAWGPEANAPAVVLDTRSWPMSVPESWDQPFELRRFETVLMTEYRISFGPYAGSLFGSAHGAAYQFGWPARALQQAHMGAQVWHEHGSISAGPWLYPAHGGRLPVLVMPLGFTLNTLLAAGVLLGVVEGFAFARRRARVRKGRCPSCGYDRAGVAGVAACPECGAASG
jgi:hypothetical protein